MNDNIKIIKQDDWKQASDGLWYVHIPFECPEEMDTIMEFVDDDDYIQEHKEDFDALNNGITENNECIISADIKPSCEMKIEIKTLEEAGGEVLYDKDGTPKYIPPERSGFDLMSMLGGLGGNLPIDNKDIIDAVSNVVSTENGDNDNKEAENS